MCGRQGANRRHHGGSESTMGCEKRRLLVSPTAFRLCRPVAAREEKKRVSVHQAQMSLENGNGRFISGIRRVFERRATAGVTSATEAEPVVWKACQGNAYLCSQQSAPADSREDCGGPRPVHQAGAGVTHTPLLWPGDPATVCVPLEHWGDPGAGAGLYGPRLLFPNIHSVASCDMRNVQRFSGISVEGQSRRS